MAGYKPTLLGDRTIVLPGKLVAVARSARPPVAGYKPTLLSRLTPCFLLSHEENDFDPGGASGGGRVSDG
jgi:hypothetical protein